MGGGGDGATQNFAESFCRDLFASYFEGSLCTGSTGSHERRLVELNSNSFLLLKEEKRFLLQEQKKRF